MQKIVYHAVYRVQFTGENESYKEATVKYSKSKSHTGALCNSQKRAPAEQNTEKTQIFNTSQKTTNSSKS